MNLYERTEDGIITSFGEDVKKGIINPSIVDLSSKSATNKYNRYIDKVAAFKPKEYKIDDFTDLEFQEIVNMSLYIINQIFINVNIKNEIVDFFNTLRCSGSPKILNGIALSITTEDGKTTRITEISNTHKTSSIIDIIHEFIHFHCSKLNISLNKKLYYEEILSIYAEKLAVYLLNRINIETNFMRKIEETRLESIVWHYKVHPAETQLAINQYLEAKKHVFIPAFRQYAALSEQALPWLKTASATRTALQYKENIAASYGLGYLYAESLLKRYLESPTLTGNKIRDVLMGEEQIQQLLDYFNINANNDEVYDNVKQKLSLLRK